MIAALVLFLMSAGNAWAALTVGGPANWAMAIFTFGAGIACANWRRE